MHWMEVTAQVAWHETARLAAATWPGIKLAIVVGLTWTLSRFVAKYQEQKEITRHMPEIVVKETKLRDARIKQLEQELEKARADRDEARALLKLIGVRCASIADKIQEVAPAPRMIAVAREVAKR